MGREELESAIQEGLTGEQIAERFGITKGSLKRWLEGYELKVTHHGNRTVRPIREVVFSILREHGPMTTVELRAAIGETRYNNFCRALRRWEKKGLITRQGVKPSSSKGNNGATVYSYTWDINKTNE